MAFGDFTVVRSTVKRVLNSSGVLAEVAVNTPAFEFNADGTYKGLLVEPAGTNLTNYSEQFDNAYWTKTNVTPTANAETAPDGTITADRLVSTAGVSSFIFRIFSFTSGQVYTLSYYVKASVAQTIRIYGGGGGISTSGNLNVTTEWTRISHTFTPTSTGSFDVGIRTNSSNADFDIFAWGAQLETGSVATSYIPTVASTANRTADSITLASASSLIGQSEGTIFVEFEFDGKYDTSGIIPINTHAGTTEAYIFVQSGTLKLELYVAGVLQCSVIGSIGAVGRKKIAFGYKANDFVGYLNGAQVGTDTSGTVGAMANIVIGGYQTAGYSINSNIRSVALFPTRLANATLVSLTTL